ncbi:RNA polymerase sigma factor [Spirosoma flavum]|uniref:RNA polymerase sigma factor n=1 Tax=Spirosoma flavum TaxID=2048557 RepID=A0ABW6AT80_9BACT
MSLTTQLEQQWLRQLRLGDEQAFRAIYGHFWEELLGFAYKKTGSLPVAEDLVQDLFISLWLKRDSLLISQSLKAYLFAILKYQVIDYIRANISRQNYLSSLKLAMQTSTSGDEVASNEIHELVQQSAQAMPERMRLIFEMSRYQGYSNEEIAQQLNLSEQTVRNQISSALKRIRTNLSDYLPMLYLVFGFFKN